MSYIKELLEAARAVAFDSVSVDNIARLKAAVIEADSMYLCQDEDENENQEEQI